MPVQSIECQLTQAQMKRYLAGADFPDEILAALERHLKVCPECMAAANQQREALGGAPADVVQAVVSTQSSSPLDRVRSFFSRKPQASTPPQGLISPQGENPFADPLAVFKSPKNLVLSGSLAIVLVLMSTVLRDPTGLFGPRASTGLTTVPTEDKAATDVKAETEASKPEPAKKVEIPPSVATKTAETTPPKVTPKSEVPSAATKAAAPATKKTAPDPVGGEVLVADSQAPASKPKPVAKAPAATVKSNKPAPLAKKNPTKSAARKARTPRTHNRVTVYLPDGTVKRN